jgi:predicted DNA-binding transcriptional regulator
MRCAIGENEKNERTSSAGYVYVEGHGWINIENFLDRIKKDIKRIEQELGSKQEK